MNRPLRFVPGTNGNTLGSSRRPLRVLFIYEKRSWHGESDILAGYERALRALGHRVIGFDRTLLLSRLAEERGNLLESLEELIHRRAIDLVFSCNLNGAIVLSSGHEWVNFFDLIGVQQVISFNDTLPTYLGNPDSIRSRVFQTLLKSSRVIFGTIRGEDAESLRYAGKPAVYAPLAFDDLLPVPGDGRRDLDVVFIGSIGAVNGDRHAALTGLAQFDLHLFGGRPGDDIRFSPLGRCLRGGLETARDLYAVYRRTRVCVDLNTEPGLIPGRLFMAMGNGALVLAPRKEATLRFFEPGRHFVAFDDIGELPSLVSYYLKNSTAAARLAERGATRIHSHHRYGDRAGTLLEWLEPRAVLGDGKKAKPTARRPVPGRQHGFRDSIPRTESVEGVPGWSS